MQQKGSVKRMIDKEFFGEGKNIEFKREIPKDHKKFLKDIIAFSNCTGGKVILGIEDITNTVYGIGELNPFRLSDTISNMISDACTPQIDPIITVQTVEEKTVVVIDVVPGRFRPYYLKTVGKELSTYIRINGTSRVADARMLQELELEGQRLHYDTLQEIGSEYDEMKAQALCDTMYHVAVSNCVDQDHAGEVEIMTIEKLEDMGILCKVGRDYAPTHAFRLLTDNGIHQAKIQCALFKGTERDIFIDRKEYKGAIFEQIEDAYQFVLKHINLGATIDGLTRQDAYELPPTAIREMICNAVCHRSYLDESAIQVSIFDDRIEVLSPGMLYGGLDIVSAKLGKSRCRNAAIADAFFYMGIIEAWGSGLPRIIRKCKEYNLPAPLFEEFGDGFKATLFRANAANMPESAVKVPENGIKVPESAGKLPTNPQELKIMQYVTEHGSITTAIVEELLEVKGRRARSIVNKMVDDGLIIKQGASRSTRYIIAAVE